MLLWLAKGKKIAETEDLLPVERTAIWRTKKNYLQDGLQPALKDKPRPGQPTKYKPKQQAEIIALACSDPPRGPRAMDAGITYQPCANQTRLGNHQSGKYPLDFKKNECKPWLKQM